MRVTSTQKLPIVDGRDRCTAARVLAQTRREAANQREHDDDAGGGRQEVLHRQRQHLRQVAHRRFAAIALPVGVGDEADGGVEGRVGADAGHAGRVERQHNLQALQRIHRQHAEEVEQQQGQRVLPPAHAGRRVDAGHAVQAALDGLDGRQPARQTAFGHGGEPLAQRPGQQQQHGQVGGEQHPGGGVHQKSSARSKATSR